MYHFAWNALTSLQVRTATTTYKNYLLSLFVSISLPWNVVIVVCENITLKCGHNFLCKFQSWTFCSEWQHQSMQTPTPLSQKRCSWQNIKKARMLNQFLLLTNVAQSEFVVNQLQDLLMVSEHIISTHFLEHHFMYR